jgi:hypothetical protein
MIEVKPHLAVAHQIPANLARIAKVVCIAFETLSRADDFVLPKSSASPKLGIRFQNEVGSDRFFSGFGNPILPGDTLMTED